MIYDLVRERPANRLPADVCIVGAGPAGIVLALELLAQGKRVTLLEAGSGEAHGTIARWDGQILEFDVRDFEPRQHVPESGWPFAKVSLADYYAQALELEGLKDVIRRDAAVWRSIGLTPFAFDGLELIFDRVCPEPELARVHRHTLEKDPDLDLWLHASVVDLVLQGDTVSAVRAKAMAGIEATFFATTFVFCLGAIESCRFFLQPRPQGLPWNRSGLLGKHVQERIDVDAATVIPTDQARFDAAFDDTFCQGFNYRPKLRLAPTLQDQHSTLNCAATMRFAAQPDATHTLPSLRFLTGQFLRDPRKHRAYVPQEATGKLRIHCEQQPDTAGSITLSTERDSLGLLGAQVDWKISDRELATIRTCVLQAQTSLAPIAEITPDPGLLSADPAFRLQCNGSNHHAGGMRMTASPENGVVDLNLRLHGTANCYICSAAVFPTSSFADPTHTVLALAVRLADHLRGPEAV